MGFGPQVSEIVRILVSQDPDGSGSYNANNNFDEEEEAMPTKPAEYVLLL